MTGERLLSGGIIAFAKGDRTVLLAIDIGNTNTVFGIFDGERMVGSWRFYTDVHKMPDEFGALLLNLLPHRKIEPSQIDSAIISSVVPPLTATYEETCRQYFNTTALVVEPGIRTGVRIEVDNPLEVGADRFVYAAAAHKVSDGARSDID
ncbi:MAG: type III pantothenate kinase, partial [Chloroflexi bacterium]|nr:type III pantothenate kinase [Chloroflexota bacterium]